MTLKSKHIKTIEEHMQYIRLTISDSDDATAAEFLRNYLKGLEDMVVREDLDEAIARRNRLNGYPSKAGH